MFSRSFFSVSRSCWKTVLLSVSITYMHNYILLYLCVYHHVEEINQVPKCCVTLLELTDTWWRRRWPEVAWLLGVVCVTWGIICITFLRLSSSCSFTPQFRKYHVPDVFALQAREIPKKRLYVPLVQRQRVLGIVLMFCVGNPSLMIYAFELAFV